MCMRCRSCNSAWTLDAASLPFHEDVQDTNCEGWKRLIDLIGRGIARGDRRFEPFEELPNALHHQLVTLPALLGEWTTLEDLDLHGSPLVRLPPELGRLENLRKVSVYTSPRLHWFPYEFSRCVGLLDTSMSTRNTYGNHKNRAPFPDVLAPDAQAFLARITPRVCSVCRGEFSGDVLRRWVHLRVGTDTMPLLVHACAQGCVDAIPDGPTHHHQRPHTGGTSAEGLELLNGW